MSKQHIGKRVSVIVHEDDSLTSSQKSKFDRLLREDGEWTEI